MFSDINVNKKVDSLLKDIEKSKNPEIIKDLCELLEDIMKIRKLESQLEELNSNLYSGLRGAFFAHTMSITEMDAQYLLEKANAKRKRMEELKRRKDLEGKELSEEEQNELKRLGVLGCEKCADKDECDCPTPIAEETEENSVDDMLDQNVGVIEEDKLIKDLEKGGAICDKI